MEKDPVKIVDLLKSGKVMFSCELFPPKAGTQLDHAKTIVEKIAAINPAFMSVTYGAGGGTVAQTVEIADMIQNQYQVPSLAHLTCVSSSKDVITQTLDKLLDKNIHNVLALRGDLPKDQQFSNQNEFRYASELIEFIKTYGDFCIGGACYPEGHVESKNKEKDIEYLKQKADAGCDFFTTQMFFDNNIFYNFLYRALAKGLQVPIVAGIMPVVNSNQIERICTLSGTNLPPRFKAIVDKFSDNPDAMKQAGIAYATEQIIDLIANDVNCIHLYTMNQPDIAASIANNLSDIIAG